MRYALLNNFSKFLINYNKAKMSTEHLTGVPLLPRLISTSVAVANHAAEIVRDIMKKGDLGIVTKEDAGDLQTEADRQAQQFIVGYLSTKFPKITIIGEEGNLEGKGDYFVDKLKDDLIDMTVPENFKSLTEQEVVIWVDPLDGTAEYAQACECLKYGDHRICKDLYVNCASLLDHVTVLIGIACGGKSIAGIINQPYFNYQKPGETLGRTIWGVVGGQLGGMEIVPPPSSSLIVTTTRSHSNSVVNDAVASVGADEVLRVGGAGHKMLLLLEGKAHAYVFASVGCKKWDTCAPQAILEAAGGVLTDMLGQPLPYDVDAPHQNSLGILATVCSVSHHSIVQKIPQTVKDALVSNVK